ncbi:hypothetical protein KCV87_19150 [Actinosynnema pretiosum subsp. pretiosum]|nr:hypothetical protein KCV87_19150 [Actinosynnema pretiosum subsp. pretiosum]
MRPLCPRSPGTTVLHVGFDESGERDVGRSVVLVDGAELLDEVLRLAAVAECELERVVDVTALRGRWHDAPVVLLDERAVVACAEAGLPRRPGVLLVSTGPPGELTWPRAVELGVERAVSADAGLVALLRDATEVAPEAGRVLAVLGGRGGAGASVLAAAVARAVAASGGPSLLVDCDPLGGGLDLALGAETSAGMRWSDLDLSGRVPAAALRQVLPACGGVRVLSCGRDGEGPGAGAVASVVEAGRRSGQVVVCDLPRQRTPAADAALDRADLAVLVVPAEVRACAAARGVARRLAERGARTRALVRVRASGGLSAQEVAAAVGVPLLTRMRGQRQLASALDRGRFPTSTRGPLAKAATTVLEVLRAG